MLYRYLGTAAGCRHDLLVRVDRPGYRNSDQGAEDAADAYADSLCAHLRSWWLRWVLPRACPDPHTETRLDVEVSEPDGDDPDSDLLYGPGLRRIEVGLAESAYPGTVVLRGSPADGAHEVFLLTDATGRLDLSEP